MAADGIHLPHTAEPFSETCRIRTQVRTLPGRQDWLPQKYTGSSDAFFLRKVQRNGAAFIFSGYHQQQDTLGHADISTTLNIYADVTKDLKEKEFTGLDAYFQGEEISKSAYELRQWKHNGRRTV